MADWFTDLVREVCAEVIASDNVQSNLALTGQETAESVSVAVADSDVVLGRLREQFSDGIDQVNELDISRKGVVRSLLPREWEAVRSASSILSRARQRAAFAFISSPPDRSTPVYETLRRLVPTRYRTREEPFDIDSAEVALSEALWFFDHAATRDDVLRDTRIRTIDDNRAAALSSLRQQLIAPLTREVNRIIDQALAASYQLEFSYAGSAQMAERPQTSTDDVDDEVHREAGSAIRALIDSGFTGVVGVAGPRGIGKTTLLTRFARPVRFDDGSRQRWGVCVAAPAQYDARDFLLHLFGQLCVSALGSKRVSEVEDEMAGTRRGSARKRRNLVLLAGFASFTALSCACLIVGLSTARPVAPRFMTDLQIGACCLAVAVMAGLLAIVGANLLRVLDPNDLLDQIHLPSGVAPGGRKPDPLPLSPAVRLMRVWGIGCSVLAAALGCALLCLVIAGISVNPGYLAAATLGVGAVIAWRATRTFLLFGPWLPSYDLDLPQPWVAEDWYRKVKYQQSYTTGWSGTVTVAPRGLPMQAQAGWSGSRAVTPLAMSIPEIVAGLRSLIDVLHEPPDWGGWPLERKQSRASAAVPVVIGIDEMDKIEDPRDAQAFLNQIKGLFGDTQCLYLISISDDAMAAYERRGLPLRDAFDSSLSTVITLSYLSRQEARSLIGARLVRITQPASDLLYVLSGGLARELVRLIHRAVDIQRGFANATMTGGLTLPRAPRSAGLAGSESTPSQAESALAGPASSLPPVGLDALAVTLIKEQVSAQRRAVLIRGRVIESCSARDGLLAWASDPAVEAKASTGSIIDVISAADYFHNLLSEGEQFLGACKNDVPDPQSPSGTRSHAGECAARETGAFLLWLATVGQVFEMCRSADDFRNAEQADSERSFERLARARQNFALGAGYVQTAVSAVRTAWDLGQA